MNKYQLSTVGFLGLVAFGGVAFWGVASRPEPAGALCASPSPTSTEQQLASAIRSDEKMNVVYAMAKTTLAGGLNAGGHYKEVWIRDFNTFIELALEVQDHAAIKAALIRFLQFQGSTGEIIDGYVPARDSVDNYDYLLSDELPELWGFKNTVETDQESSLVQAIYKYVTVTGDTSVLAEVIAGETLLRRLEKALEFVLTERYSAQHGLIWGATSVDWGDVQPQGDWGVDLSDTTPRAIDIYDNAMLIIAAKNLAALLAPASPDAKRWLEIARTLESNVRTHLWDAQQNKFRAHVYLTQSPFPAGFDESTTYFHGGSAMALQAKILQPNEAICAHQLIRSNVEQAGAPSIGLTVYPPYPADYFDNAYMKPYSYQNGGDWTWFGARWISGLVDAGRPDLAYLELQPMLDRVIENNGFFEWYDLNNVPRGATDFKGSAGSLSSAISALRAWAEMGDAR